MNRIAYVLAFGIALSGSAAHAHHSIASAYDNKRQETIEGEVAEFRFIHPHPVLMVDVAVDGAEPERWQLEMDNRTELAAIGITAATWKPGDRVIARGSLGRAEPQCLYLLRLDRPADGLRYEQVGTRPRIHLEE
ncbi:MAG TPA: DUF6152 family protein [Gammaproteobacteria bacterium]|jgi:hypothetical protein